MTHPILARHNVNLIGTGSRYMMLAHGFGCDQNIWRFIAPAFERDYRIVLFDYVGHGKSDRTAYDVSRYGRLDSYADDVLQIAFDVVRNNGERLPVL